MTPEQIYSRLDGLIGYQTGSADGGSIQGSQVVADWVQLVKVLLKSPSFRYLDDFEFKLFDDLDEGATGAPDEANDATHFIAALVEMTSTVATDAEGRFSLDDSDAFTIGTANPTVLQDTMFGCLAIDNVTTTGVSEFYPLFSWAGRAGDGAGTLAYSQQGLALTTGLAAGFTGTSGGVPATDSCRAWILYRT
mgnify:CR=1 FL=1